MTKRLLFSLIAAGCIATSNAADVTVIMNSESKTMTLTDTSTGEPVATGDPNEQTYSFSVDPGSYRLTAIAADGVTVNGSIIMTVDDTSGQEFKILTATVYASNTGWKAGTDYTLDLSVNSRDGKNLQAEAGESRTAGRLTFIAFSGNSYHAGLVPSESHISEGYTTLRKSGTLTANVNVSGAIPMGEEYTITYPADASMQLGIKFSHFVDFTPVEPVRTLTEGDVCKATYFLAHGQVYNYRTWIPGKLTRAGYFTMAADPARRPAIELDPAFYDYDPHVINHTPQANSGYETGDIMLNINSRHHLQLQPGETFKAHAMRSWELTDNMVSNYFIEPDFHFTVTDINGNPSANVVEITRNTGSAWADIKAISAGTAIVTVTYDAIGLNYYSGVDRKPFIGGEFWGAIWPENTAVFVVTVGQENSSVRPEMTINEQYNSDAMKASGKYVDAEHDIFYYLDSEPGALYTFLPEGAEKIEIAYPVVGERSASYTGFGSEGVTCNADGSVTLTLRHGRQIVKMTDASGRSVYQVLTAKQCHREIINASRPGSCIYQPGDEVTVQYDGLFHPANKMAGIYNMSAYVTYNGVPNGSSLIQGSGQYTFASSATAQCVRIKLPADMDVETQPELVMDKGVIQVNGFGDPIGNHRIIDPVAGRSPNFTAISHKSYFGSIPEVRLQLSPVRTFDIRLDCPVEDAEITMTFGTTEIKAGENGLYSGTYGTYSVIARKAGYRCFRHTFSIEDDADGLQTFNIEMQQAPEAWDGKTMQQPEADQNGVYLIGNGAQLAWFSDHAGNSPDAKAKLTSDIDLGLYDWKPIGQSAAKAFSGTFYGNGHRVSGLFINLPSTQNVGLFGYVKGSSADTPAIISGVETDGYVNAKAYVGGIAGYVHNYVSIKECANHADIIGSGNNIGGIAGYLGYATSDISCCYNTGRISGTANVGGIAGGHHNTQGACISRVFNTGLIEAMKDHGACVGSSKAKINVKDAYATEEYNVTDSHTLVTSDQMRSGEVAYRLGLPFGQDLGREAHPVLHGEEVKYDADSNQYYNGISTGVEETATEDIRETLRFDLRGIPAARTAAGVSIILKSDGTTEKVIKK